MDTREKYRQLIEKVLVPYSERVYSDKEIKNEAVFDRERDHYLVMSVGWQGYRRVQHSLLHLDIIDGKVLIQRDGTEYGIANEHEEAGDPKSDIVLAFHYVKDRALIPEYVVA